MTMSVPQLHSKMRRLHQRYKEALEAHELGRAGLIRDEAAMLLAQEWMTVLDALGAQAAASEPLHAREDNVPREEDWPARDARFVEDEIEDEDKSEIPF